MFEVEAVEPFHAVKTFQRDGRPDRALEVLLEQCDPTEPHVGFMRLKLLAELEDNRGLQSAVRGAIERLPEEPRILWENADAEDYLVRLCQDAASSCLDGPWLRTLLRKTREAAGRLERLGAARAALSRREAFGRSVAERLCGRATLISLGLNCMPWSLVNSWGLRTAEEFESLFTPFAYGVHKLKTVRTALATDFADYCNPEKVIAVETPGGHMTPMRMDLRVVWNHNLGAYWIGEAFARLHESVEVKAQNFRRACRAEDAVFLVSKAPIRFPQEPISFLGDLNARLEAFTGRARNRLILWNEFAESPGRYDVDDTTVVLNSPYPNADFIWYDHAAGAVDEALDYEQACAEGLVECLEAWGLLRPRPARPSDAAAPAAS
jgi:hypothetical protein